MEKVNYFLVLEKRLGDYNIIDINKIDICDTNVNSEIASIDSFTCRYTESEIRSSIIRSNIAHSDYFEGALKIVSDAKHNFKALTKDVFNIVYDFQNNDEEIDRNFKNKLFGIYKKVVEHTFDDKGFIDGLLNRFKDTLKTGSKLEVFKVVEELPYSKSRAIYFAIYEEELKRKEEKLRKLEKLNDAA